MFPPEITVEDLLLVVALAAIASLILASFIRRYWHNTPFCLLSICKRDKCRELIQKILVIALTSILTLCVWYLFSTLKISDSLHNTLLTTHLFPFRGFFFASLITALVGWFISKHLNQMLSTEEKLHVSEERFRKIVDNSPNGIITISPEGRFISVNRSFCLMTSYEESDLLGRHFIEITHPNDRDKCLEEIHLLLERRDTPMILEKRYLRKGGEIIWVSVVGTMLHETHGQPAYLIGQVQDITQRRMTEAALQLSETKFRLLVEESLVGVYIVQDGKFIYANPRLAEITGYSCEELMQLPSVMEVVALEDRPLVKEQILRRMNGEISSAHYQFRCVRKDGNLINIEVLGTKSEYNGSPALLGTVLDITQQKDAEEALRATIENTPNVSVQWYDDAGQVLFWNKASEKIFGWTACEATGKRLDQFLLSTEDFISFLDTLKRIAATNQAEGPTEYMFTKRDGQKGWCLSTVFSIPPAGGRQRFVCMDIDISAQKLAETSLRELSGRLLKLQDEERRRIARELHDTTAQALAALAMNLNLLRSTNPNQSDSSHKLIDESLQLAERSVQEIRTLSYLLHPPELDMIGLPAALREYAAGFSRRSQIETIVDISPDISRLTPAQELTIFRIVQESLGNILRHARSSIARIILKPVNGQILLEIRDWGKGIPPETLEQINQMHGQIGVGIAGMRERLRQLGGKMKIQSNTAGTTIQVSIPITNHTHL